MTLLDFENLKGKESKLFEILSLKCVIALFVSVFVFHRTVSVSSLNFSLHVPGHWGRTFWG